MGTQPGLHGMRMFLFAAGIPHERLQFYVHIEPGSLKETHLTDGRTEITWRNVHPDAPRMCCDFFLPEPDRIIIPQEMIHDIFEKSATGKPRRQQHMNVQPTHQSVRMMFYGTLGVGTHYVHIKPDSLKVTPLDDGRTEITWCAGHPDGEQYDCCDIIFPYPDKIIVSPGQNFSLGLRLPPQSKEAPLYCQSRTRGGSLCTYIALPTEAYCRKHLHAHGPIDLVRTSEGLKSTT